MKPSTAAILMKLNLYTGAVQKSTEGNLTRENKQTLCARMLKWNLEWALSAAVFLPSGQWCCCPLHGPVQDVIFKARKQLAARGCSVSRARLPTAQSPLPVNDQVSPQFFKPSWPSHAYNQIRSWLQIHKLKEKKTWKLETPVSFNVLEPTQWSHPR